MPQIPRRKVLGGVGAGLTAVLTGCAGGSDQPEPQDTEQDQTPTSEPTNTATSTPEGPTEANVPIGKVVSGEDISMVVRSVETTESINQFQEADSGNTFYVVRMAVKNTSSDFLNFSGFWQARITDSADYTYNATFAATEHPLGSDVLAAGEVSRGDLVFELPKDASGLDLQFDFTAFSLFDFDRVTVTLDEQADSIADLSQSLQIPINKIGDSVSNGDVTVTLNSVRTEEELGPYTQAKDGEQFHITNITVTNETDEPLSVSTILQMAIKDGSGLTYGNDLGGTSALDRAYAQGSDMSPGGSRRGELAYALPKDITTAYWTFNFYDFAVERKAFWEI